MTINIVKSGGRSLEVMEFFADCRDASVMQVARALGYPQSSTSQLLQSLAALGYLRYDPRRRTFCAGARAALLGGTLSARVFGVSDIAGLIEEAARAANRDAHVCDVIGGKVHYLLGSTWNASGRAPAPLTASAAGLLFLSSMPDVEAMRLLVEQGSGMVHTVAEQLARVRRSGYALHLEASSAELAVPLNRIAGLALVLRGQRFGDEDQAAAVARRVQTLVRQWRDPQTRRR